MTQKISSIIKPEELLNLRGAEDLLIFDVSNHPNAKANYEAKHLEGALRRQCTAALSLLLRNWAHLQL